MSKRFTSTLKWRDGWFHRLSLHAKVVFLYVVDTCDAAGVWEPNHSVAEAEIGFTAVGVKLDWQAVIKELNAPVDSGWQPKTDEPRPALPSQRVMFTKTGKYWVANFCRFQYGKLRAGYPMHVPALRSLAAHGLLETYAQLFPEGIAEEAKRGTAAASFPKPRPVPTMAEVRGWPEAKDMGEDDLQLFFHHYAACGWRQPNGKLYSLPPSLLAKWRAMGRARPVPELSCPEALVIQSRIERIEARIAELGQQTHQPHPTAVPQARPEALEEIARLQTEKTRLQTILINGNRNIPSE